MKEFKVLSVNISEKKGERKVPVESIELRPDHGVVNDAHAGPGIRQVSLLGQEDIDTMIAKGFSLSFGDFAENITTEGIELWSLPIGTQLQIGEAVLEVTQIGKKCHQGCEIMKQTGDCIMPKRGIFAKVVKGGAISNESVGSYDI